MLYNDLNFIKKRFEDFLHKQVTHGIKEDNIHTPLNQAIEYVVLNPGKRLRPMITYSVGQLLNLPIDTLDIPAAVVELIHCYSLVHDDLPGMDNDDLRRGKPTCHIKFNEATAILVGDALQSLAFELITDNQQFPVSSDCKVEFTMQLAKAIGRQGMVLGQAMDMQVENNNTNINIEQLKTIHKNKTGKLIEIAATAAVIVAEDYYKETKSRQFRPLSHDIKLSIKPLIEKFFAIYGLAFQAQDDLLDCTQTSEQLGKPANSDINNNKQTFISILGKNETEKFLSESIQELKDISEELNNTIQQLFPGLKNNNHLPSLIASTFVQNYQADLLQKAT